MATQNKNIASVRRSIETAMELAEEDRRRKLAARRLDLARSGVAAYNKRQILEAVKAFHAYLKILEEMKNVSEGALTPACFDTKADIRELLMISAIYWDLAKIYDRTRHSERQNYYKQYLDKYVLFSKGLPYQPLSAETLRKYISNKKPIHREEFKNAYRQLSDSKCFIATSLIDLTTAKTLPTLRRFRGEVLQTSRLGRYFIRWYYRNGPSLAQKIDHLHPLLRKIIALTLDGFAYILRALDCIGLMK